jgi:hypothetical protein
MFFLCESFLLDIRPFVHNQNNIDSYEIASISNGPAKKLARGFFSFNPAANSTVNRHAFWSVQSIVPNHLLGNDGGAEKAGFAFDFFAARPVPASNSINPLVERDLPRLARNQYGFYDLDGKWPIEVSELQFEKTGSNADIYQKQELELYRPWMREKPHRWRAPVDMEFGYYSLNEEKSTDGYQDFRVADIVNYIIKLTNYRIQYDGNELTDIFKELNTSELSIVSLQWSMRQFQSINNYFSTVRDEITVGELNTRLIQNVLEPNGIYLPPEQPVDTMNRDMHRDLQQSAMPPPVSYQQSAKRRRAGDSVSRSRAYYPDMTSSSNQVVEPVSYGQYSNSYNGYGSGVKRPYPPY